MSREIFITQQILLASANEVIFLVASTALVAGLFDKEQEDANTEQQGKRLSGGKS